MILQCIWSRYTIYTDVRFKILGHVPVVSPGTLAFVGVPHVEGGLPPFTVFGGPRWHGGQGMGL